MCACVCVCVCVCAANRVNLGIAHDVMPFRVPRPMSAMQYLEFEADHRQGPPVVPFYPFLEEGSPTKTDYRQKGTLILTSLLEDLAGAHNRKQ